MRMLLEASIGNQVSLYSRESIVVPTRAPTMKGLRESRQDLLHMWCAAPKRRCVQDQPRQFPHKTALKSGCNIRFLASTDELERDELHLCRRQTQYLEHPLSAGLFQKGNRMHAREHLQIAYRDATNRIESPEPPSSFHMSSRVSCKVDALS